MSESKERILTPSMADLSYKEVIGVIGRRKWIVLGSIVAGVAVAAAVCQFLIKPVWVASAQLLVPGRTIAGGGVGTGLIDQLAENPINNYDVLTQIQLLQSQEVIFRVYNEAGVQIPRTFREAEDAPKIDVFQQGDTQVLIGRVSAPTESIATKMAQALPIVYQQYIQTKAEEVVNGSISFLNTRMEEEKKLLEAARTDLAEYQRQNNVSVSAVEVQSTSTLIQNGQAEVRAAEAGVQGAESALAKTREERAAIPATVTLPVTRSNVALIDQEKRNLQTLQTQLDGLLAQYLPEHPLVRAAKAQVDGQKAYLASIPLEVKEQQVVRNPQIDAYDLRVAQAETDLAAARSRLSTLQAKQREIEARKGTEADTVKGLTDKERTVANHETSIQQLKSTLDALMLKKNNLQAPQQLNRSTLAEQTQPNWPVYLGAGAVVGLFLGVLGAMVRDFNQDKVMGGSMASTIADSYVLARVPRRLASAKPIMTTAGEALSFESYRILRTNLVSGEGGKGLKSVVVTSTSAGEGASTVAGNLAVALAQEGKKTVLLDANMRNPVQDRLFDVAPNGGLNQALSQGTDAASLTIDTSVPNLKVLVAGGKSANATEALASPAMDAVLTSLKGSFDYIVVDAPAAFTTADAHEVGRKVDGVLYVVESGKPSRSQLAESIAMLRHAGGKLLGLVMNKDKGAADRLS
ncbi:MAG: polysaccharide biosynthesis tyrosine autokinase [Fimbriimonadaceae bacterium]|nr:polysaccharide biosynthesis tyrosine autokinase [Fimbriimonadaceae bacterium]